MVETDPQVSIIILNYNNYEDTAECLRSLEHVSYENYDVYVVDNGSTDDSGRRLRAEFDRPTFIFNERNEGFAGGNQVAINQITEENTGIEYFLLLNNDTVATDDFLTPLVEVAEQYSQVGIVGGLIEYYDNSIDEYWYAGGSISPYVVELTTETEPQSDQPYETGYVSGALMLISADFANECDILRREYFFGRDQLDISWRARQNDWRVMVAPDATIKHKVSATVGGQTPFKVYYDMRGRLFFAINNLRAHQLVIFLLFFVFTRPIVFAKWAYYGKYGRIHAHLLAIFDVLRDEYPDRELPLHE